MKRKRASKPSRALTENQQSFTFSRRSFFLGGVQLGIGGLLAARMGWIAIAQNEKYALQAESNRVNLSLMLPRRGWIVDRNGLPLATNKTSFRVDIIPERLTNSDAVLGQLQTLLTLPDTELARIKTDIKKASGFQPIMVAENISYETFAAVSIRTNDLRGVVPSQFFTRFYPDGPSVGHLCGYVGAASSKQYEETKNPLLIMPGFKIGKEGLEKVLEPNLRGTPGARRTEVMANGRPIRELETTPDKPGQPMKLTIDAGLQAYTSRRIGMQSGAAVVIDCTNGGILAMSSMPSFDPNNFSDGIGRLEWKMMQEDEQKPMLNKAVQGLYPPGSTVKPAAALAALMMGVDPEETIYCGGGYMLGGRRFRCLGHHGPINMRNAIMKSCNTYFYTIAHRLGYDNIAAYARMLGMGQRFDLPVPSQYFGTGPDSGWLKKKHKRDWGVFDSLNATIGQGYVQTSPLQLAVLAARIASGRALIPRLIQGNHPPDPLLNVPPEYLQIVREGMDRVVNANGTAVRSRLNIPGVQMAGKTGTAQVRGLPTDKRRAANTGKYRDHGLFVFFAPSDAPRYAGAVVIEHGMGGAKAAAPVAKDMMTYLFEPERAMATLQSLEAAWGGDPGERLRRKTAAYMAANDPAYAKQVAAEGSVEDEELAKKKAEEEAKKKAEEENATSAEVDAEREGADSDTPEKSEPDPKSKAETPRSGRNSVEPNSTSTKPTPPSSGATPVPTTEPNPLDKLNGETLTPQAPPVVP